MATQPAENLPELVFALVGAAGTRLDDLSKKLKEALETFGYQTVDIRLSGLLQNFAGWTEPTSPGKPERTRHLQNMGDAFRQRLGNGAAMGAKHIIAAGIRRVVYLEPYPKSRALRLHGEEITSESATGIEEENKVVFFAFSGVAPCQYRQLFSMAERGAKKGNSLQQWYALRVP